MEKSARVRLAFQIQSRSTKEIIQDLRLSGNTMRKILRPGEMDFSYDREQQSMARIGPWQDLLEQVLSVNASIP